MQPLHNHIILIGFKHVGKSVIGKNLANRLRSPFIDLDRQIELLYGNELDEKLNCRQIMKKVGEDSFRCLEIKALCQAIDSIPSVISLGGGAAIQEESQKIIKGHLLVHITAPAGVVFERIKISGRPAFLNSHETFIESFNQLWDARNKIYENLCDFSILNNHSIDDAIEEIMVKLNLN